MRDQEAMRREGANASAVLLARLIVGLAQGALLYALFKAKADQPGFGLEEGAWRRLIETLRLFAAFAPLPLLFGLGNLPLARLAPWSALAALAVFIFGWFAAPSAWSGAPGATWLFSLIVIYIAHEFVQASFDDRRRIASYETYFDRSWRHGFQAALSIGFVIAFWIVISLGATMFRLIGLEIVPRAIFSDLFRNLASAAVFALGLHLSDADTGLTRGARQIGLALLSWLAILMTIILAAFLCALPFTGLEPLWDTKRATVLLLNAAATMILLINAAYQAGDPPKNPVMRVIVRFSAIPLAGVVLLAALGLFLRVNQYGFTPARVLAGAELLIVAVYAAGYLAAAFSPGAWLSLIRPVNIAAALFVAAILTALMTPLMDPARVAVADQVSRLDRGAVEPDDFDFGFLTDARAGRWGEKALAKLAARSGSERDDRIALLAQNPSERRPYGGVEETFADRRAALILIGAGDVPDAALLPSGASDDPVTDCVASMKAYAEELRLKEERARQRARLGRRATETAEEARLRKEKAAKSDPEADPDSGRCPARLIDLDLDGDEDLLVLSNKRWGSGSLDAAAILNDGGSWRFTGRTAGPESEEIPAVPPPRVFAGDRAKLRAAFERLTVAEHKWRDGVAGGARIRIDTAPVPLAPGDDAIVRLDAAVTPDAARAVAPFYNMREFCPRRCFGKRLTARDGADDYAVISVAYDGRTRIALFDGVSGAYVAGGAGRAEDYDDGDDIKDDKTREAHRAREYRRIAETLETAPPLLGDLLVDDVRLSFAYRDEADDFLLPPRR